MKPLLEATFLVNFLEMGDFYIWEKLATEMDIVKSWTMENGNALFRLSLTTKESDFLQLAHARKMQKQKHKKS